MPMMVNGFDHRPLKRNSSTYSDFDDEEEEYPKEVSPLTLGLPTRVTLYLPLSFSECCWIVALVSWV
jgi:hypothetical protein